MRTQEEILPWDIIDSFIDREYLISEKRKAESCTVTPDCREGCTGCGVNRYAKCFVNCDAK